MERRCKVKVTPFWVFEKRTKRVGREEAWEDGDSETVLSDRVATSHMWLFKINQNFNFFIFMVAPRGLQGS